MVFIFVIVDKIIIKTRQASIGEVITPIDACKYCYRKKQDCCFIAHNLLLLLVFYLLRQSLEFEL